MSSEKSTKRGRGQRGPDKGPRLKGDALKFAQNILAIRMSYPEAVHAFLESFPEYANDDSEHDIVEVLTERFQRMLHETHRVSFHKIKETEATLKELLDCIPIASPLKRLIAFEKRHQYLCRKIDDVDDEEQKLELEQELKVIAAEMKVLSLAAVEMERLMPRERTSPFGGLPDLPNYRKKTPSEQTPSDETDETDKVSEDNVEKGNAFGGAMMKNVNPK